MIELISALRLSGMGTRSAGVAEEKDCCCCENHIRCRNNSDDTRKLYYWRPTQVVMSISQIMIVPKELRGH